jgi:hypothetical protein
MVCRADARVLKERQAAVVGRRRNGRIKHRGCEPGICVDADEAHNEGSASLKCSVMAVFSGTCQEFSTCRCKDLTNQGCALFAKPSGLVTSISAKAGGFHPRMKSLIARNPIESQWLLANATTYRVCITSLTLLFIAVEFCS